MANFIEINETYAGKDFADNIINPQFIGKSPLETQGIRVMTDVTSRINLFIWGTAKKLLKKYVKGFNPVAGASITKRTITTTIMKGEFTEDGMEFYDSVKEELLRKGYDINDISGTILEQTCIQVFMEGVKDDMYRQFWLNDTAKETVSSGVSTGIADTNYNAYEGMWKLIFNNASFGIPSATEIQAFDYDASAVKQVQTATITGASGTANVLVEGVNYLLTFATSLTQTNANFVTAHAAALLLRGFVVTASTDTLIFTSTVPGSEKGVITVVTIATLAGTVAQTTANTAPAVLTADQTVGMLKTLEEESPAVLVAMKPNEKFYYVDGYSYRNYLSTLEGKLTTGFSSEDGRMQLIDGVQRLFYRGVEVINLDWQYPLSSDFPHATGERPARPYRIIYAAKNNLVMAIDAISSTSKLKVWFNDDEEENRYRIVMKTGANYVHNNIMAVAYEQ